ncbi:TPA: COP9 signalosome complex subunit 8 [Trebouxia sp. C0005]
MYTLGERDLFSMPRRVGAVGGLRSLPALHQHRSGSPVLAACRSLRRPAQITRGTRAVLRPSWLICASAAVSAKPEQLWEQLKSDADAAYKDASDRLKKSEHAEEAAAAAEAKLGDAKKKADTADLNFQQTNSAAQKEIQTASDALTSSFTDQQGSTRESLNSLALSRLDRWQQAHPSASGFQKVSKTEAGAPSLPDFHLVVHVASVKAEGKPYAVVGIAAGATSGGPDLEGLLLHWACVSGQGQEWQQPPSGWHTDPDFSQGAGKAWQTPLGRYAPQQGGDSVPGGAAWATVLQLPLEGLLSKGGGVQFVVKRAQGAQPEWLSGPDNKDFFISLDQAANVVNQAGDSSATSHPPTEPPAPKERALMPAGMDKHAKKAHWDQRKAERARARQRKSEEPASEGPPVGSSEDWVVLDSGKSFAWSAKQHGSLQQQINAMEKLIQQKGQQDGSKAAQGLALASNALDAAKPVVAEAEEASKAADAARSEMRDVSREASHARDKQQSVQAEAELAVRAARRAACRLKGREQEVTLADLHHIAEEEQKAWFDEADSRQHIEGMTPQRNTFRIQSIDGSVVSYETLCKEGDKHFAVISIVGGEAFDDGELDETSLHWACTPKQGGAWEGPPAGWKTEPDSSLDAGGGAYQTLLKRVAAPGYPSRPDIAVHAVTIQVPLEGSLLTGGIAFVLKTGQQQWLACRAEGVLRSDFFISTQQAAEDLEEILGSKPEEPALPASNGNAASTNGASAEQKKKTGPASNGSEGVSKTKDDMLKETGGIGSNK